MQILKNVIVLLFVSFLLLNAGCSDRGSNIQNSNIQRSAWTEADHVFFDELIFQLRNKFQQLFIRIYTPRVSFPPPIGNLTKVPLLVLLPPQDGNQFFYFNHGLMEVADELIANGEIEPMAIAVINNDAVFGGYFYASNGPGTGNYDTLVGGTLIEHLNDVLPFLIDDASQRGIGGVGMGAYGAYRAAILHPGVFTSISAVDGPMDFNGADNMSGFLDLFDDAMTQQSIDQTTYRQFDSSGAWHLSRLFIGGALAFSPLDTAVNFQSIKIADLSTEDPIDSILVITITQRFQISDTTTLISDVVTEDVNNFDFLLPFDSTGQAYDPIWQLWLDNNLENMLASAGAGTLSGVDLWFGTSTETRFGFYDQTSSWMSTLAGAPYNYPMSTLNYQGYPGNPATDHQYLYDLLKDILVFHSNSFKK